MTKRCGFLAGAASLVLAFAAIWLGGLNQDEGWYLYAARLVRDGQMPYRDFFFTQGPVLPFVYAPLAAVWAPFGLLGARTVTLLLGATGLLFALATVRLLVPADRRQAAAVLLFLVLGCNLYHLHYLAIPKTYALASLFVHLAFFLLTHALVRPVSRGRAAFFAAAGLALAFAAGTRISLGALLAVAGLGLLLTPGHRRDAVVFGLGGAAGLALCYGPFLLDPVAREGLRAAQAYHAARQGFSPVFLVGSLSRLFRWYAPLAVIAGLAVHAAWTVRGLRRDAAGASRRTALLLMGLGFGWVAVVHLLAPFPYEDYQVPVMGLAALVAVAGLVSAAEPARLPVLVLATLGLSFVTAFGSPLLERWTTDGQDRFWTLRKSRCEMAQLREAARLVERLDPGGTTLLTQDLYLAVETGRTVPKGLEMGPFSRLSDEEWRTLLTTDRSTAAALSGYSFAIEPPACTERDRARQDEFRQLVHARFNGFRTATLERFGQQATRLEILTRPREEVSP